MARYRVSYVDDEGVHPIEMRRALYEAAAQAIVELKEAKTISTLPGPERELTVVVLRKLAEHTIRQKRAHEWAQVSNTQGPIELLRRGRVRKMLLGKAS